jgi:hypothetical protein
MSFSEGTKVIYKNKTGIIDFVDTEYVVVRWDEIGGSNPARLVVYPQCYNKITLFKSSEK